MAHRTPSRGGASQRGAHLTWPEHEPTYPSTYDAPALSAPSVYDSAERQRSGGSASGTSDRRGRGRGGRGGGSRHPYSGGGGGDSRHPYGGSGDGPSGKSPAHRSSPGDLPLPPLPTIPRELAVMLDTDAEVQWRRTYVKPLAPHAPTVYLLRGISGTGKSCLTRALVDLSPPHSAAVCSADTYFVRAGGGVYAFDITKIGAAHASCQADFERALYDHVPVVIVDNTNTTREEYAVYEEMHATVNSAIVAGSSAGPIWPGIDGMHPYELCIVELHVEDEAMLDFFVARNAHGVNRDILARQLSRFEPDPRGVCIPPFIAPSSTILLAAVRARYAAWSERRSMEDATAAIHVAVDDTYSALVAPYASARAVAATGAVGSTRAAAIATAATATYVTPVDKAGACSSTTTVSKHSHAHASTSLHASSHADRARTSGVDSSSTVALRRDGGPTPHASHHILEATRRLARCCSYVGIFLDPDSTSRLQDSYGWRYPKRHGDHVTVKFAPRASDLTPQVLECLGSRVSLRVVEEVDGMGTQALVVAWADEGSTSAGGGGGGGARSKSKHSRGGSESKHTHSGGEGEVEGIHTHVGRHSSHEGHSTCGSGAGYDSEHTRSAHHRRSDGAIATSAGPKGSGQRKVGVDGANAVVRAALSECIAPNGLSANPVPHITMSTVAGLPPATSNTLLERWSRGVGGESARPPRKRHRRGSGSATTTTTGAHDHHAPKHSHAVVVGKLGLVVRQGAQLLTLRSQKQLNDFMRT